MAKNKKNKQIKDGLNYTKKALADIGFTLSAKSLTLIKIVEDLEEDTPVEVLNEIVFFNSLMKQIEDYMDEKGYV